MRCEDARRAIRNGEEPVALREHLRGCADCLELSIAREPANLFLSLGGDEHIPPGGLDTFVTEIMGEVRLRETEKELSPRERSFRSAGWWSAAAAVFLMVATWFTMQPAPRPERLTVPAVVENDASPALPMTEPAITRPVIDDYDQSGAMIVELPAESTDDLKIVMIFDETLPQDL